MPTGTYEFIQSFIFSTPANSITLSSIPATYDDLVIIGANITGSEAQTIYWRANGDTGTNYAQSMLLTPNGFGVALTPSKNTSVNRAFIGSGLVGVSSSLAGGFIMQINQYSQSSYAKVANITYTQGSSEGDLVVSMWEGTNAINSLTIFLNGGNFQSGTRFSIYGIKKAVA